MKVILTEPLEHVGSAGEIVDVKPGYARNFLLPRKLAFVANTGNMAVFKRSRVRRAHRLPEISGKLKREQKLLARLLLQSPSLWVKRTEFLVRSPISRSPSC